MGLLRSALASRPVAVLTQPHGIDRYLEQLNPMWTVNAVRARVLEVRRETGQASTVVLKPNGAWLGFRPGQHVEFGVEVDGVRKVRVFSVSCSALRTDGLISVSVKSQPGGFVSQYLHDGLTPGAVVHLSQAKGTFVLPAAIPERVVLLSGGSGITPMMSMLRTLADRAERRAAHLGEVTFVHYARSREEAMFADELDELAGLATVRMERVYTRAPQEGASLAGRFSADHLATLGIDPAVTPTWVCGPGGLIASVREVYGAAGATAQLREEYFKVPTIDLEAADATGTVTFDASGTTAANSGATLLEQAEAAGLTPAFGCRMGVCNTCAVKKLHGAVRHAITGEVAATTDQIIKPCVTVPVGDVSIAL